MQHTVAVRYNIMDRITASIYQRARLVTPSSYLSSIAILVTDYNLSKIYDIVIKIAKEDVGNPAFSWICTRTIRNTVLLTTETSSRRNIIDPPSAMRMIFGASLFIVALSHKLIELNIISNSFFIYSKS